MREMSREHLHNEKFIWPPRRPGAGSRGAARAIEPRAVGLPSAGVRLGVVDALRVWAGLLHDRFVERAREAGWAPDNPGDFCPLCAETVRPNELGPDDRGRRVCARCRASRMPWTAAVRLGEYEGLLRDAVLEVKFGQDRRLGYDLGELLGDVILSRLEAEGKLGRPLILVPAPMSARRRVFRGIDHTLTIARGVRAVAGGRVVRALRRRHGPSQTVVPTSERRRNVAKAFRGSLWAGFMPPNALVVFIDDVRTTGATALEGARALKRAWGREGGGGKGGGREIWAAFLAVTPGHGQAPGR